MGHENTYNVTLDEMLIFVKAVARGAKNSFIIGDMPFMSYNLSVAQGLENAGKMIKAGANAVKLEGCNDHIINLVKRNSIKKRQRMQTTNIMIEENPDAIKIPLPDASDTQSGDFE